MYTSVYVLLRVVKLFRCCFHLPATRKAVLSTDMRDCHCISIQCHFSLKQWPKEQLCIKRTPSAWPIDCNFSTQIHVNCRSAPLRKLLNQYEWNPLHLMEKANFYWLVQNISSRNFLQMLEKKMEIKKMLGHQVYNSISKADTVILLTVLISVQRGQIWLVHILCETFYIDYMQMSHSHL